MAETKKFKSQLIVLEGVDGTGKTYLINQLVKDYPGHFERLKFPTDEGKQKLVEFKKQMDPTNIDDIIKYNFIFIQDIIDFQPELNEILFRNRNQKHVLMDRYYFSSFAYLKHDINKYFDPNKQQAYTKWGALKDQVLHKWVNQCRVPDHVLLLINNFAEKDASTTEGLNVYSHEELQQINAIYKTEILAYHMYLMKKHKPNFQTEEIEALNKTDFFVQNYLLGHGIVDQLIAKQ